jgi:ABC-type nickel/cobalt efflux system permease component RcnA
MKRVALVFLLMAAAASCFAQEVPNPFTAHGSRPRTGPFAQLTSGPSAVLFGVMAPVQKTLNDSMAAMTRSLADSRSLGGLLLVVALALAYGIFHAAGPGHGKTIVSSFLLANEAKLRHSFAIGYLVAAVHALSALAVVLIVYYLIRGIFAAGIESANHYIQLATFAVIAAIGLVMLVRRVAGHGHSHAHAHEAAPGAGLTTRNLVGIAVPAGVIPCPGAVAVILFALSLHMLAVSVMAVSAISVGMGTTISATGAIVILVKRGAINAIAAGRERRDSVLRRVVEIGGAAVLFLFGLLFFLAQL